MTHLLLHSVSPVGQATLQLPLTQVWPEAQVVEHLPQFLASVWRLAQLLVAGQ